MTCRDFQIRLQESIERRLPPDPATDAHFSECTETDCRSAWDEFLLLNEPIAQWRQNYPQVDLAYRVLAELQAAADAPEPVIPPRHQFPEPISRRRRVPAVVAAVSVACLAVIVSLRSIPPADGLTSVIANRPVRPAERQSAVPDAPSIDDSQPLEELGLASVDWIRGATSRISSSVAFVLPEEDASPRPDERPRNWLSLVAERLQPFEESLNRTLHLFLDGGETESGEQTG